MEDIFKSGLTWGNRNFNLMLKEVEEIPEELYKEIGLSKKAEKEEEKIKRLDKKLYTLIYNSGMFRHPFIQDISNCTGFWERNQKAPTEPKLLFEIKKVYETITVIINHFNNLTKIKDIIKEGYEDLDKDLLEKIDFNNAKKLRDTETKLIVVIDRYITNNKKFFLDFKDIILKIENEIRNSNERVRLLTYLTNLENIRGQLELIKKESAKLTDSQRIVRHYYNKILDSANKALKKAKEQQRI